jgi:hypothetical protein
MFVKVLLRSPLHGLMSHNTMLLSFKGRKSGKHYTLPISYIREGDTVICFTDTRTSWWKNLRNVPVTLHLKGQHLQGIAEAVQGDRADVKRELATFLQQSPRDAKYKGVRLGAEGQPDHDDIAQVVQWAIMVQIHFTTEFPQ